MQVFASTTSLGKGRTDLAVVLPAMMDLGFDGIELGSNHLWRSDFAGVIKENRPPRILTHNYFPPCPDDLVINVASPEPVVRLASIAHARNCIDFASEIGAELYTIHPGFMAATATVVAHRQLEAAYDFEFGDSVPYEQSYLLMRDALGELLEYAKHAGMRLAIETEGSVTKQGILLMERPDEYRRLFAELGGGFFLNFNLAHSRLAAGVHGFDLAEFIREFGPKFAAVEVSHNDGERDQHRALISSSYVFEWLPLLPDVPLIIEVREASAADLSNSAHLLRSAAGVKNRTGNGAEGIS
jgi:sugar phosphate isomerase/epimerase